MKMPFGRYKGLDVAVLPTDYLTWLIGLADLREPLRSAVLAEARKRQEQQQEWRGQQQPANEEKTLPLPVRTMAERLVGAGYRALAQQCHPDHSGDHEAMVTVNLAAETLRHWLREAA